MKVTLKKIKTAAIETIQSELLKFIRFKVDNISHCKDYEKYCNDIIIIDILQSMFFVLRTKIESKKETCTVTLKPSQAVILLYCCGWQREERTPEQKFTMQSLSDLLHEKLVNI